MLQKFRWLFVGKNVLKLLGEGKMAYESGQLEWAKNKFEEAIGLYDSYPISHYNLANVHRDIGNYSDAEKEYNTAIKLKPMGMFYNDLGALYHKWGRKDDAEFHYRKAIEIEPGYPYAHINLATLLRDKGKFEEAEREYKIATHSPYLDEVTREKIREFLVD